MSHWIPLSRVHFVDGVAPHDLVSPSLPAPSVPSVSSMSSVLGGGGGSKLRSQRVKDLKMFYLTDAHGTVLTNARGEPKTYECTTPCGAAAKIFSAYMRSPAGRAALSKFTHSREAWRNHVPAAEETPSPTFPAAAAQLLRDVEGVNATAYAEHARTNLLPRTVEIALASALHNGRITLRDAHSYRDAYWEDDVRIYAFTTDVFIGRRGTMSVRRYVARYAPLLKPNPHEIHMRINKTAVATHIPRNKEVVPSFADASELVHTEERVRRPSPKRVRRGSAC